MFCKNCGKLIEDGAASCSNCGTSVSPPSENQNLTFERADSSFDLDPVTPSGIESDDLFGATDSNQPKKPKKKKKLILWIVLGAIVLLLAIFAIFSFPFRASFECEDSIETKTGIFEDFAVEIGTNQPIESVYYALDPKNMDDLATYTEIEASGLYSTNITIPEIQIPVGENKMYICVTSIFGGKKIHEVDIKFDMGYSSAPDPSKIMELEPGNSIVSNELILFAKEKADYEDVEELIKETGGEIAGVVYPMNQYQVKYTGSGQSFLDSKINQLERSSLVDCVIYNSAYETDIKLVPNDSKYDNWTNDKTKPKGNNWGHECIDSAKAWEYNDDMKVVKVGVIDSYLDYDHEDLQIDESRFLFLPTSSFKNANEFEKYYKKAKSSHSCSGNNCNVCSAFKDHGTHVSGIVGALGNNDTGICGVNWNSDIVFASYWYMEKYGNNNFQSYSTTMSAFTSITHCVMSGCRVINLSLGSSMPTPVTQMEQRENQAFDNLIKNLEDRGFDFLICKSAGNSADDAGSYRLNRLFTSGEHARAHTIMVGAIANHSRKDSRNNYTYFEKAGYSCYGDIVDVMAPGSAIYSTIGGDKYASWDGTSMATPMVTGTASLLYSLNPGITYDAVKSLVCNVNDMWCFYGNKAYPVIDAGQVVSHAVDNGFDKVKWHDPEKPDIGYIYGTIRDAQTNEIIEDAKVTCKAEDGTTYTSDVSTGIYQAILPVGKYDLTFSCNGYISETVYDVEVTLNEITYNILLNMVGSSEDDTTGVVEGYVVDAFDASTIPNADVKIYKGINCTTGNAVETFTAGSDGFYSITLEAGNYTAVSTAPGYEKGVSNIICIPGETLENQDCIMTPILNEGEIRVVLTWGAHPSDLDSHFVGPTPDGGKFHTYYSDKNYHYQSELFCMLDVDDTSSYGPETTSVYHGVDGTYTFLVHDYSNRGSNNSSQMATSGAQVKVYVAGASAPKVFNVPNASGTVWKVCSIKGNKIRPINEMSYTSDPGDVGAGLSVN